MSVNTVRENDTKCKVMTGLSWTVFDTLHQYLVQFVKSQKTSKMSTQDQLFITLVKLRQNHSTDMMCGIFDLAHRYSTFLDVFSRWLDLMYANISFLIKWPDRECIRSTVPAEVLFQYPRVTAIIDCFEIRIEHSKKLKTRLGREGFRCAYCKELRLLISEVPPCRRSDFSRQGLHFEG
ncbi:uncharacterized protein LOC117553618 isoform X3 [Gymnodraco acuticeps]|uniref:Uncharacterized protein LOC117553618 isoform X3 n=1 Tax=Gymnodraco acuticeps TaxID=8218 RepID=A0A6P8V032_GYMAC|nr:uncharacterized protein LOC117553618 isoform X3 [Gymnodraco acuticeps]